MGEQVIGYFTRRAGGYAAASRRWPWRLLRRAEASAVAALLGPIEGRPALDLGCGAGFYTEWLLREGAEAVWAVDACPAMLTALPTEFVNPVLADAARLNLDRRFPVLLSAGLLEFVADPGAVLATARRHALPGAVLVLLVPRACLAGRGYALFHRLHGIRIRLFEAAGLAALAERGGWRVTATRATGPFSLVLRLEAGAEPG